MTQPLVADPDAVHDDAIVVNGLAQPGNLPLAYEAMIDGGITATNLTVAANEGFAAGMLRLEHALATMESHPRAESLRVVCTTDEIRRAKRDGVAGVLIGFQNADPIEDRLEFLSLFHRLGLRVLQLTYQRRNLLGDGCGEPADAGLSIFGREVIDECNRLGILVDLSHVGFRTTMDAIEASDRPVVFSHANVHAINPIVRNKTDEQIQALAENGGVMGITSISRLMTPEGRLQGTGLDDFLDQIDHIADLVGVDHVGIGLDISEGMTEEEFLRRRATFLTQFPELTFGGDFPFEHYFTRGLSSAAQIRSITGGLAGRGYGEPEIRKIVGGNFMRVLEATIDH